VSRAETFDEKESAELTVGSPNVSIRPVTCGVNEKKHLTLGGLDVIELANTHGTPLWLIDEQTIRQAIQAVKHGLDAYPHAEVFYAGKAFLCSAMCHLIDSLGAGLDVVSAGELFTAKSANFPANKLLLHGNNKSPREIEDAITYGDVRIVIDSQSELEMVAAISRKLGRKTSIFLRMIPEVEPDADRYLIKTGHSNSKFGNPIADLNRLLAYINKFNLELELVGLHAHIGSGIDQIEPFLQLVEVMTGLLARLKAEHDLDLKELDLGGGVAMTYTEQDKPIALYDWSRKIAQATIKSLGKHGLMAPRLLLEPGKAVAGTAGITLYRVGHIKTLPDGTHYIAVDGGMADNPRPITYQANYTAVIANRVDAANRESPSVIVGKYCEEGDVLINETYIDAKAGDIVALFGTGAYNYSQSSNYNRSTKPACLLVYKGDADVIVERESNQDLLRHDRVPPRLLER
jgi:diaminopimelate decarboxylase